jgi:hypothetical protein
MENTNDREFKELSPKEVRDLQLGMRHFFINYPHEELKKLIWELYRGWVYNSAEYVMEMKLRICCYFMRQFMNLRMTFTIIANTLIGLF